MKNTQLNNAAAYTPLAIGSYRNAEVVDCWVEKVTLTIGLMFIVEGKKVPFYGSLKLTPTKDGFTVRYYTLLKLEAVGYSKEKEKTFTKDVIGQIANLDVVHYIDSKGQTRAKVDKFYAVDQTTLADVFGADEEELYK
jgi:hypothetical protein